MSTHRNEELAAAMRELRNGSRTSPHRDRRTRKARTRSAAKGRAIRDSDQRGSFV